MTPERPALERRVLAALDATPPRIPVLLGGCGTGRTSVLLRLREHLGRTACQYIDLERVATTPERCLAGVVAASPFPFHPPAGPAGGARQAFEHLLAFLQTARASGGVPASFLIDELLELRTFESFPGLRASLRELLAALGQTQNRFVLTTRYVSRAHRLLREASPQFEVIHVPPLSALEVRATLDGMGRFLPDSEADELSRSVHALTDGRPAYVRLLGDALRLMEQHGPADPVSALAEQLSPEAPLALRSRYCYEMRLHRARGYGALKAILDVLAETEPLTLTEIAQRLRRTPGSTKDYLSWLEDVDLVTVRQKRYSFPDPLLRLWVRLNARPAPPTDEDLAREVQAYALARLPRTEPVYAGAAEGQAVPTGRAWGIIEID